MRMYTGWIPIVTIKTVLLCAFGFVLSPTAAVASVAENICDRAARTASGQIGVPFDVLHAITRVETGRSQRGKLMPWPWTVNMQGKGRWFDSDAEARDYVSEHMRRGARSFDVGCFQINYRWHGHAFASVQQMFDPEANALYAAQFLKQLHSEFGNWTDAAGAFHSRTPKYANRYKARYSEILRAPVENDVGAIIEVAQAQTPQIAPPNRYPFFKASHHRSGLGSLVPTVAPTSAFIVVSGQ